MDDKRVTFESGHVRGDSSQKVDYTLAVDGPMFKRWAEHLTRAADTHGGKRNWLRANTQEELERAKESALRHMMQWINGDSDEDHAAAVFFNINLFENIKTKLNDK